MLLLLVLVWFTRPACNSFSNVARLKTTLSQVSNAQLSKLKGIFAAVDVGNTGMVFCSEILQLLNMVKSPFTDHLFSMVGMSVVRVSYRYVGMHVVTGTV